ncbi:SDR family oxidoreductase [Pyxidicoccus parkwayensis]|uniref:SDR family oxidoreductase n=1 Tax=Pyxidicoccus parkwayensis TaxID=2813578 RepID=A0ABX7P7N9_9BACT|nr:SDR family oxidoreductase [Pyxidicoccus parkwaysis]QSQ26427.1 SDR family oxidoreductase [Pyxidicoccus parkwaysis]
MGTADLFDISGRVALVTGASRGLGRHFALTLARRGVATALAARDVTALTEVARVIQAEGGRAVVVPLDVTDARSVQGAIQEAAASLGPLSIVVNNAGVVDTRPWDEQGEADWDRVVDTNLKGVWLVAQEAARHWVRQGGGGTLINVASILGLVAEGGLPAYCASKAGVVHLTRALAIDLARHGIRVNALAPGYFETDINREFLASPAGQALVQRIPQQRTGRFEELDGPLLLLASDASRFMTGSVLVVDGGHTAVSAG